MGKKQTFSLEHICPHEDPLPPTPENIYTLTEIHYWEQTCPHENSLPPTPENYRSALIKTRSWEQTYLLTDLPSWDPQPPTPEKSALVKTHYHPLLRTDLPSWRPTPENRPALIKTHYHPLLRTDMLSRRSINENRPALTKTHYHSLHYSLPLTENRPAFMNTHYHPLLSTDLPSWRSSCSPVRLRPLGSSVHPSTGQPWSASQRRNLSTTPAKYRVSHSTDQVKAC